MLWELLFLILLKAFPKIEVYRVSPKINCFLCIHNTVSAVNVDLSSSSASRTSTREHHDPIREKFSDTLFRVENRIDCNARGIVNAT